MSKKESNPKDLLGVKKPPMSCVPTGVLLELGAAMFEGARKYGRHNYRVVGVRSSVYYDAALRHLMAWWEGEDLDPDSGVHHLVKAMACMAVCRDAMMMGKLTDDRPPRLPQTWMQDVQGQVDSVIERYPNSVPPYVHEQQQGD